MGMGMISKLVMGIGVGMAINQKFWGRSGMGINICPMQPNE